MQLETVHPAVDLLTRHFPGSQDFTVAAARVQGSRHQVVIDTLLCPADMAPFTGASLVVYTHSDWDHCWGTAAFPGAPVIGHALTRERLMSPDAAASLAQMQQKRPDVYAASSIVLPSITFTEGLTLDVGGLTLCLEHLPGHTADSVVIHLPELNLLLAGDAVETPIPSLNEAGQIRPWAAALRRWERAGLTTVVPSHGRPGGPEILQRNLDYIETLLTQIEEMLRQGLSLEEMQARTPVEAFVPDIDRYPAYYRQGHLQNLTQVVAELTDRPA